MEFTLIIRTRPDDTQRWQQVHRFGETASVRPKSQYVLLNTLFVLAIPAAGSIVAAVEKTGLSLFMCRSFALDLDK
ncbi:hypothetical protein N9U42_01975 [Luminiphilus sp.]|nr:hypothetical protein [Luminiphilus sp.]MDA9711117.1 hypothetical protein [Luminiphilus sp.]